MNSAEVIAAETKKVIKGTAILTVCSLIICIFVGQFNIPMILGFLLGSSYAVYNFYSMGNSIKKSFDMPPHKLPC